MKNIIQDLIESGEEKLDGHTTNDTYAAFKVPLLDHEKENSSNNKSDNNASYNEASFKYINNILEGHLSQYYANVITFNDEEASKNINATTRNQAKVILHGVPSKRTVSNTSKQYNLLDQLKKTPAHISILEIFQLFTTHREILDKALNETYVPAN